MASSIGRRILHDTGGHPPGTLGAFLAARDDWETPPEMFERHHAIHRFNLDPCANARNAVVPTYFDKEANGLAQRWTVCPDREPEPARVWLHPPHSECALWTRKAVAESRRGALVVALVPARTGDAWFHEFVLAYADDVKLLRGTPAFRLHRLPMVSKANGFTHRIGELSRPLPTGGFALVLYKPKHATTIRLARRARK